MDLQVQVNQEFHLDIEKIKEETDQYVLIPPDKTQFNQLVEFLKSHPQDSYRFNRWVYGIGATALCYRWGTYLAFLMDENKPVDPRANNDHTSMIADEETKRNQVEVV